MAHKHSTGRWLVNLWTTGRRTIETENGLVIAEVHTTHLAEEHKANADLLAAAPHMLAVLELVVAVLNSDGKNPNSTLVQAATSAIAQAEGR